MSAPLARAEALLETGRAEEALHELATLPAEDALSVVAMRLRCAALSRLDRWAEVGDAARAGLGTTGPDPDLLYWLGRAEQRAGRPAVAERVLLDGLALAPTDVDLLCAYADLCLDNGQVDKAAKLVDMAAAQAPRAPMVYAARVQVAFARGDDRAAQQISREFVGAYPDNPAAHALLGSVSASRGQVDAAYAGFRRAAATMPGEQVFAESALEMRAARHPLMLPLRPILRFGPVKTWLVVVVLVFGLRTAGVPVLAGVLGLTWVLYCVYSWVVPPLVRRWVRRNPF